MPPASSELTLSVSDFVALFNQTLEYAYPSVIIVGELANFRVSKNRWVYFNLKDDSASVKFFGTVYQLSGPLEDGLLIQVRGVPHLHPLYGFSVNIQFMSPVGEGSLKKAAALLEAKLTAEGLFDAARKRLLPYPPTTIGLITSRESAAYHDFMKILNERWVEVMVQLADVQVQGEAASDQIVAAIDYFNSHSRPVDVLVITRGGGSPDDLASFNTEQLTRAVAGSRIPTLVAIGHEVDVSLAELAADQRASTPSNAAQLLVPDKKEVSENLKVVSRQLQTLVDSHLVVYRQQLTHWRQLLGQQLTQLISDSLRSLQSRAQLLNALSPIAVLQRGYAVIKADGRFITSSEQAHIRQSIDIILYKGLLRATIQKVKKGDEKL